MDYTGKLDLASFDGKAVVIYEARADGTFKAGRSLKAGRMDSACTSLNLLGIDEKGRAGLLLGCSKIVVIDESATNLKSATLHGLV